MKSNSRDKKPNGFLWDLDNTLYRDNDQHAKNFNMSVARSVIEWGLKMDVEEAFQLAQKSFRERHLSIDIFVNDYKVPDQELHFLLNKYQDHSAIKDVDGTENFFALLNGAHPHAIITHASRVWANAVLDRLRIRQWFADHAVFGYEDYGFESKATSRRPFEQALTAINMNASDTMFVEDTAKNLAQAHAMGMTTVYLHHGRPVNDLPDYVDETYENLADLIRNRLSGQ